jgi:hypothetical protein
MPRRATRARRIKLELEVTIIFVFANSFSQIRFRKFGSRWWWSRELRGQPDNTPPAPNGTDDRALRALSRRDRAARSTAIVVRFH